VLVNVHMGKNRMRECVAGHVCVGKGRQQEGHCKKGNGMCVEVVIMMWGW